MALKRLLQGLPAYAINGISVALGIGFVQLLVGASLGVAAAFAASSGAIYASLADLPNPPERAWRRILLSAVIGCLSGALVMALHPFAAALGILTALLGFGLAMTLVWGQRAGPHAFVGILALVFTMAAPPLHDARQIALQLGYVVAGATLYFCWAMLASRLLQKRYRSLALAEALASMSALLRGVGNQVANQATRRGSPDATAAVLLRSVIKHEALLADRLQGARDFVFAAPTSEQVRRQTGVLLRLIDLRDTLLASQLDIGLLGEDAHGEQLCAALAAHLAAIAAQLDDVEQAVRLDLPFPAAGEHVISIGLDALRKLSEPADGRQGGDRPASHSLAQVLYRRAAHMSDDIVLLQAWSRGDVQGETMTQDELRLFISPEGWPLAALRANLHLESPVLRHALRVGLALGCAYFIALHLPWASHPHWLVLSVAVVLRGNLEQTLARRNLRVLGTALGCVLTLLLMHLHWPWFATLAFLVAAGIAHSFVVVRYLVTATAATTMALLQIHLPEVGAGLAIAERLADTVLGAALAWGFSYVLPYWERRSLPLALMRVRQSLVMLSEHVLRWPEIAGSDLPLRLARREAYDSLNALAAATQRTAAEPERVQLSVESMAELLAEGRQLLAQLASTRLLLTRRVRDLDQAAVQPLLETVRSGLEGVLVAPGTPAATRPIPPDVWPGVADEMDLPGQPVGEDALPWLKRRLARSVQTAQRFAALADRML